MLIIKSAFVKTEKKQNKTKKIKKKTKNSSLAIQGKSQKRQIPQMQGYQNRAIFAFSSLKSELLSICLISMGGEGAEI